MPRPSSSGLYISTIKRSRPYGPMGEPYRRYREMFRKRKKKKPLLRDGTPRGDKAGLWGQKIKSKGQGRGIGEERVPVGRFSERAKRLAPAFREGRKVSFPGRKKEETRTELRKKYAGIFKGGK